MTGLFKKILAVVLLLVALMLINDLASRAPAQADLTKGSFFTLSPSSNQMLARIERPVQVELYFSSSRKGLPIGLKVFAQRVEQLLRQYERRAGGKLSFKVLDPAPGSREEEEAKRLGLASQPLGPDERLYFGLAVFHGGNRRTIPLIDFRRERLLEYDISRLIQAVQIHKLPKLAVASSLEVFGKRGMPKEMQKVEDGTAEWQFIKDLRASYDLEEVHPTNETLPGNTDLLLVINPTNFDPRLLHAIDQYILSGKPAVVMLDPYCYFEVSRDETDGNVIGETYAKSSDLPDFLKAWGVQFSSHEVIGDLAYPTEVPVQDNQPPIPFPVWLSIPEFDDTQPVTAGFDLVMVAHTGYLRPAPGSTATMTPLLRTSRRSAPLPVDTVAKMNPYRIADAIEPTGESYVLAATIEGKFGTAFPNGKPPAPPEAGTTGEIDPWVLGLKTSKTSSRVILIADADFLKDAMAYEMVSRGNNVLAKPRNNNSAFIANCLDNLSGSQDMVPIRAKGQTIRPFTRIHKLKRDAEDSFRQDVQRINSRLSQLEEEITDLNRQAARGGTSLVSEKALTAIRRAQKEENGLRARRTEIQQQLQQRIDVLYRKLTVINLGAVPGLVALGGIVFWMYRTRRRVER
jgi:ABC-type uncharacterized transport system involved in gliding motility auxiliary subunit